MLIMHIIDLYSGVFVVENPEEDVASTPEATEHFLVLSESKLNEEDGGPADFIPVAFDFTWEHVTNGQLNPTLTFKKGENVRFRAVNAGVEPAMMLHIENHTLLVDAFDGYPVPNPEDAESVALDAGVRAEFLVNFDNPGTYKFKRAPWNLGITGNEACRHNAAVAKCRG